MSDRYDLMSPRKRKDGKTFWLRIGTMFRSDKGGFNLIFDALPLTDAEGRCAVMAFEPRDQQQGQQSGGGRPPPDLEDSIPFGPEFR